MSTQGGLNIITDGLEFQVDAANKLGGNITNTNNIITPSDVGTFVNDASVINDEFDFDGVDDYISFLGALDGWGNKFTFDVWVKFSSLSGTMCIFHKTVAPLGSPDIGLFKQGGNNFHFSTPSVATNSTTLAVANTWYNVTVVYETTVEQKVYVNGVLENTDATAQTYIDNNATPFNLGAATDGTVLELNGKIANLKVYKSLLTATEISQNYEATKHKFE